MAIQRLSQTGFAAHPMPPREHPLQNTLERYYCGRLYGVELEVVEKHVVSCRQCRMRVDSIRRFVDRLVLKVDDESW